MIERNMVPAHPQSALNPNDVERFLLYQLDETHGGGARENPLPQGALITDERIYHVSGREEGSGSQMYVGKPSFIRGNPIDIMGGFIQKGDFFAFNNRRHSKTHWYQHRHLTSLEEGGSYRFKLDCGQMEFTYRDGMLVPEPIKVEATTATPVGYLSHLKEEDDFWLSAAQLLSGKRATELTDHLF